MLLEVCGVRGREGARDDAGEGVGEGSGEGVARPSSSALNRRSVVLPLVTPLPLRPLAVPAST